MPLARSVLLVLALVVGGLAGAAPGEAQLPPSPTIVLQPVATGLASPVSIAHAGDGSGRLFIVQQGGQILIHDGTQVLGTPFLDISDRIATGGSEQGLLGLAFHPNYTSNGLFYVHYTATNGNIVIAQYSVSGNANVANHDPEVRLKDIVHDQGDNHNGGQLQFGPDDYLYAAVGDGGTQGDPENDSQTVGSLLGKLLRLDVDAPGQSYIPASNPFGNEVWALGLRNPWRFSFDRQTGDLFIGDVGYQTREEIDFQPAGTGGLNYCWSRMEGRLTIQPTVACTTGTPTPPILELFQSDGNCSIIGGYRYRGTQSPALQGWYLYGDFCSGQIHGAMPVPGWTSVSLLSTGFMISTFGEDQAGELYVADYGAGAIYRIVAPGAPVPTGPTSFFTLTPCRVADTRNPPGPSGGPALAANTSRAFPAAGLCGIPTDAVAIAINVTVVDETDVGDLRLYPAGGAAPTASALNFAVQRVRANNAIIPLGTGGQIAVQCDMPPGSAGTTHFLFDVTGYFR